MRAFFYRFKHLSVGDKVIIANHSFHNRNWSIGIVTKVNKKTFAIDDKPQLYSRDDGSRYGNHSLYGCEEHILVYDDESWNAEQKRLADEKEKHEMQGKVSTLQYNYPFNFMDNDELRILLNAYETIESNRKAKYETK